MLEYLHLLTFFSWLPLALLAGAQQGQRPAARVLWTLCGLTFVLCGYLLYLEFIWSKTVIAPIRVDLLLLIPLGTVTFTAVAVWGLRRPGLRSKIASVLLLALSLPTLIVFVHGMWRSGQSLARLNARPALIFEARFRNPQTFEHFFGTIDTSRDARAGHFRAEDPNGVATRVIINDRGHFWLMFKCGANVECLYAHAELGSTPLPSAFTSESEYGAPHDVVVSEWSPDRMTLSFTASGRQTFVRAPLPLTESIPAPATVLFHGAFSQTRIDRDYIYLVQMWLWQSGDRWLAYYVRRNAKCGSTSDFVSASPFTGTAVSGRIAFKTVAGAEDRDSFDIQAPASSGDRIEGEIFYRGRPFEPLALTKRAILQSPLYDSAPLAGFEATADWLKTVSMGESMSWTAECAVTFGSPAAKIPRG